PAPTYAKDIKVRSPAPRTGIRLPDTVVTLSVAPSTYRLPRLLAGKEDQQGTGHYHVLLDQSRVNMFSTPTATISPPACTTPAGAASCPCSLSRPPAPQRAGKRRLRRRPARRAAGAGTAYHRASGCGPGSAPPAAASWTATRPRRADPLARTAPLGRPGDGWGVAPRTRRALARAQCQGFSPTADAATGQVRSSRAMVSVAVSDPSVTLECVCGLPLRAQTVSTS